MVTDIYILDYSPRLEDRSPEIQEDDLIIHIYKRQRIDRGSELQQYLEGPVTPEKTDILQWWKVMLNSLLLLTTCSDGCFVVPGQIGISSL